MSLGAAPTIAAAQARVRDLRVGIDAHMIGERETGNESYIVNLIRGLAAVDSVHQYMIYSPHPERLRACAPLGPNFIPRKVRPGISTLRIPVGLPARAAADRVDVLHVTYIAPPVTTARVVVTVHDIAYALYPEMFSRRDRALLGSLVPFALRQAAEITTVSASSRSDIARYYQIPEDRITVIYNSISPAFRRLPDQESVEATKGRYDISGPYLLAVGNLQPRKNLPRLIHAFAALRRTGVYQGRLVLVGQSQWHGSDIQRDVHALGLQGEVICTRYVPEEDVVALYNGADVFVYPSLYEGFGLPPLEAMACGCPVVTGNRSSLPEVVGTAALMVDPTSEDELAAAILRILRDADFRQAVVGRGQERAAHFTAEWTARAMIALYQRAASKHGGALQQTRGAGT